MGRRIWRGESKTKVFNRTKRTDSCHLRTSWYALDDQFDHPSLTDSLPQTGVVHLGIDTRVVYVDARTGVTLFVGERCEIESTEFPLNSPPNQ